jgi:hypothetical protein
MIAVRTHAAGMPNMRAAPLPPAHFAAHWEKLFRPEGDTSAAEFRSDGCQSSSRVRSKADVIRQHLRANRRRFRKTGLNLAAAKHRFDLLSQPRLPVAFSS